MDSLTSVSKYILPIEFDRDWQNELKQKMEHNGPWDPWSLFHMAYDTQQFSLVRSFDELICLKHIEQKVNPLPHQLEAAKTVLHKMSGRAILADEVGLGKTIEAGLVLKEYIIRGLVKKALILVPASLVLQWVRELNEKFGIPAIAHKKVHMWTQHNFIVASIDTAKREPHKELILSLDYDLLLIDEAHKLKNKKTETYQFVNQIRKKYCLLLTATPVQNDLNELYNLITILKPGQLGDKNSFHSNFTLGKRTPKNKEQLQQELAKIMIRNRRSEGNVAFTKRHVKNIPLDLSAEEYNLYVAVTEFIRKQIEQSEGNMASMLPLITLQREVCSSRDAVFLTLVNLFKKTDETSPLRAEIWKIIDHIKQITSNTKAETTLNLIRQIDEKVIVFTEYRASQEYLLHFLQQNGIKAVPYRGGMNRGKKDWMMDLFRDHTQVMIATEAGGEGINLQFAQHIINFDLPWNPMRVEQRIGRVHRLGQEKDVFIYNLSTNNTIEEHILHLLHEKINMFELTIGKLDTILENLELEGNQFEKKMYETLFENPDHSNIKNRLEEIVTLKGDK